MDIYLSSPYCVHMIEVEYLDSIVEAQAESRMRQAEADKLTGRSVVRRSSDSRPRSG